MKSAAHHTEVPVHAATGRAVAVTLLGLTLCALSVAGQERAKPEAPRPVVSGQVVDPDGAPIRGARIELLEPATAFETASRLVSGEVPEPQLASTVDREGRFSLTAPRTGLWLLEVRAEGYLSQSIELYPLMQNEELLPIALRRADAPLTVRVFDADGRSVAGAQVDLQFVSGPLRMGLLAGPQSARAPGRDQQLRATTDGRGAARFDRDAARNYDLRVDHPDFAPKTLRDQHADDAVVEVRLERGLEVETCVVTGDASPASDAVVSLNARFARTTDDQGCTVLHFGERQRLEARSADGSHGAFVYTGSVRIDPDDPRITIELLAPRILRGEVRLGGGPSEGTKQNQPLPGATVWVDPGRPAGTDARGRYEIAVPPPIRVADTTIFQAAARGARKITEIFGPASLDDGSVPTLDLEATQVVSGVVLGVEQRAVADVTLWVRPKLNLNRSSFGGSGTELRIARSDGNGRFTLPRLPTDVPLELFAEAEGYAPLRVAVADLEAESEPRAERQSRIVQLLPGLRAFGWVVDESGVAVPGARIQLRRAMAGGSDIQAMLERAMSDDSVEAWSDDEGRFAFTDLETGRYDLRAEASSFAPAIVPAIDLPAAPTGTVSEPYELGTVTLSPGVELTGFVRDPDGAGVEGVELRLTEETQSVVMVAVTGADQSGAPDAVTGRDGGFSVGGLAEGRPLTLSTKRRGYADASQSGIRPPTEEPLVVTVQPAVSLTGRVLDPDGDGVAASLSLRASQGSGLGGVSVASIRSMFRQGQSSAEDGSFEIADVPPGTWDLSVTARGFQTAERNGLELKLGEAEGIEIRLDRGATLSGIILGADGSPAEGAVVKRVEQRRGAFDFRPQSRPARSSSDGRYTLDGLPTGRYSISVAHPRHQELVRDVEILPGDNALDFRLEAGHQITGRVIDDTGLAVADARIQATQPTGGFTITVGGAALREGVLSGRDGSFVIEGLSNGSYRVTADKEGFATASADRPVLIDGRSESGVVLTLSAGAAIAGQVTGLPFDDLSSVQVMAIQPGSSMQPRMATVDYEGNYRLDNLSSGDWMVMASLQGGGRSVRESVTLDPGLVEYALDLEFSGGWTVSGQVLRGGEPVSGYQVIATGTSTTSSGNTSTDQDGRFVLEGLETDVHTLIVTNLRGSSHQEEVDVSGDREITVEIRELTVRGRVVDSADGAGLEDAALAIEATGEQSIPAFRLGAAPRSGAGGVFELTGVAPGTYRASASLDGYATGSTTIEVTEFDIDGVEISLERSSGLVLTVLQPGGGGVVSAQVAALDPNGNPLFNRTVNAGEGGRVELSDLPSGTWTLLVSAAGTATWQSRVDVPGPQQTVMLPRAGGLRITVPALRGTDQLAEVVLRDAAGEPYRSLSNFLGVITEQQLADGIGQLQSIRPGTWTVEVRQRGSEAPLVTGVVQVVPDAVVEAVLE